MVGLDVFPVEIVHGDMYMTIGKSPFSIGNSIVMLVFSGGGGMFFFWRYSTVY